MHLAPEELIDVAEGTRSESSAPHLASCEPCRRHVADLRATMAAAADVDVPEPSPLFWDHLSDRVHAATAASSSPSGWNWWLRAAGPFALATAAAILVAFVATMRLMAPDAAPPPQSAFVAAPPAPVAPARETLNEVTDPSLAVVAGLSDTLDWDEARDAGLAPRGSADHAVTHMSERELRELRDLLRQELANSGA
jgi:hypothetical protein